MLQSGGWMGLEPLKDIHLRERCAAPPASEEEIENQLLTADGDRSSLAFYFSCGIFWWWPVGLAFSNFTATTKVIRKRRDISVECALLISCTSWPFHWRGSLQLVRDFQIIITTTTTIRRRAIFRQNVYHSLDCKWKHPQFLPRKKGKWRLWLRWWWSGFDNKIRLFIFWRIYEDTAAAFPLFTAKWNIPECHVWCGELCFWKISSHLHHQH